MHIMGFFCMRMLHIHVACVLSWLGLNFTGLLEFLCFLCVRSCIYVKTIVSWERWIFLLSCQFYAVNILVNILDTKWNVSTQRQIICPVMTFTSLGNFGGKLQVIGVRNRSLFMQGGGGRGDSRLF